MTVPSDGKRPGPRLVSGDEAIADADRAPAEGRSTTGGRGPGPAGSRRRVDEIGLVRAPGRGARVTVTTWAR